MVDGKVVDFDQFRLEQGLERSEVERKWRTDEKLICRLREMDPPRVLRPLGLVEARGACLYWALADAMVVEGNSQYHTPMAQWVRYIDEIWRRDYELRDKTWRD